MCVHYSGNQEYNTMKETRYLLYRISESSGKGCPKNVRSASKEVYTKYPGQEQSDEFCLTVKKDSTQEIIFESDDKRKKCVGVFREEHNRKISVRRNTMI